MGSLIGADLNGVWDRLTSRQDLDEIESMDLGIHSGFVHLRAQDGRWFAGTQISRAPHGRGIGWGEIGVAANRIHMSDLLNLLRTQEAGPELYEPFVSGASDILGDSDLAVFAVPDAPGYGEAFRDRYLRLLRRVDGLRPLLLWRPVATLLGWIKSNSTQARLGSNIGILSLMPDGVHLSVMTLENEEHRGEVVLVPQRSKPGEMVGYSFCGITCVEDALTCLALQSGLGRDELAAAALTPWQIATGETAQPELVRLAGSRGWLRLPEVSYVCPRPDPSDLADHLITLLRSVDILLIEGPFNGNTAWRQGVLDALAAQGALPPVVVPVGAETVARGCLEAAVRARLSQPIYFDFLPQLQINAMVGDSPAFVDLIRAGQRCQGGRPFKAEAPGKYAIGRGATKLPFWLFKQDFTLGRKIVADLPTPADRQYPLTVSIEQTPGQGFAQVRISSVEFDDLRRTPITLDWTEMEEIHQNQEEILDELRGQTGLTYPDTAIIAGHPFLWIPSHPSGDLRGLLREYRASAILSGARINSQISEALKALRLRFSRPETPAFIGRRLDLQINDPGSFRTLSSDGSLPEQMSRLSVPEDAADELDRTLEKLQEDFLALQRHFSEKIERKLLGDVIGFASWCFWRCPPQIAEVLLGTYEGEMAYDIQVILLREGVARVIRTDNQLERYFGAIARRLDMTNTITAAEYSGLGRVLGASENAASILSANLADRILQQTIQELQASNAEGVTTAYKKKFKAALRMLAVLLRHRKARSGFLDPEESYVAQRLLAALAEAERRNRRFSDQQQEIASRSSSQIRASRLAAAQRFHSNAEIIVELSAFIHLEGRDPNIIRRIDALDDD